MTSTAIGPTVSLLGTDVQSAAVEPAAVTVASRPPLRWDCGNARDDHLVCMDRHARAIAAGLGVILAGAWMVGWATGASSWLVWTDLLAACATLGGLGPATTEEISGIATWPFAGLLLFAMWLFGMSFGATRWLTWLNFGVSCAFLFLTVAYTVASRGPPQFHYRLHHRPVRHT